MQNGRDHISDVAGKFNVSRQSAKNVWKKFVDSEEIGPRDKKGAQNLLNLTETKFEIIEFLKRDSPSMPLFKIHDVVDLYCAVPGGTSKAAVLKPRHYLTWTKAGFGTFSPSQAPHLRAPISGPLSQTPPSQVPHLIPPISGPKPPNTDPAAQVAIIVRTWPNISAPPPPISDPNKQFETPTYHIRPQRTTSDPAHIGQV